MIRRLSNKKGLTLIELIIVIAIIGILAVIIVPRVGAFRNSANIASDRATLRTVQGAVNMYIAENGEPPTAANYEALNTSLDDFLGLNGGAMPLARSEASPGHLRTFLYDSTTGVVTIDPPLPDLDAPPTP